MTKTKNASRDVGTNSLFSGDCCCGREVATNDDCQRCQMIREIQRLQLVVKDQRQEINDKCDECAGLAHVVVESGFNPGVDSPCRCDECKTVCKGMDEAGYLGSVKERWWDDSAD